MPLSIKQNYIANNFLITKTFAPTHLQDFHNNK